MADSNNPTMHKGIVEESAGFSPDLLPPPEALPSDEGKAGHLRDRMSCRSSGSSPQHFCLPDKSGEERSRHADRVFEGLIAFINGKGWRTVVVDRGRRLAILGFSMMSAPFKVMVRIDADAESITINTTLPIACLKEYRILMGCKLCKLNENLRYGAFRLDEDDGEITYRFTYSMAGQEFLPEVFEKYLSCCLLTPDMNYAAIAKTATGSLSNQEKIRIVGEIKKLACAING